ncbi:hypothetical protein PYW07_013256 [Mythimna separata]|uniref:Protein cueball n=1 Tax=Mythimna separata TaxID=271217 RepID=A0AAD7Y6C3_MYTSE|nr:hypothetical protein PYW07_013256 [Mythimna separata]
MLVYYYKSVGRCRSRRLRPRTVPGAVCSNMWRQSVLIALLASLASAWDIAVTAGDRIEFYNIGGTKTDTVHFPSQNLTALAYDEVHDMLLYVDKQSGNDAICGYKMSFQEYQCYVERNGRNIQGLAFDPLTEKLFFTDMKERSINWFSFKPGFENKVYGNLLIKLDEGIPTDIAVDSCRGYVYWINTNITSSTIERARFDGSDREVVIKSIYKYDLQSLVIDQQMKQIYWKMPSTKDGNSVYVADLNGKNQEARITQTYFPLDHVNAFAVTKQYLLSVSSCTSCNPRTIFQFPKPLNNFSFETLFDVSSKGVIGIVTNYKIRDQFEGISECVIPNNYEIYDSTKKTARQSEGPFCVHGTKFIGQSICKCTPGYTGVRCEASVCDNYCLQGNCSFTDGGLPKCRCEAGYTGDRCEVNVCNSYCLNDGTCSLNEEDEPICECTEAYEGRRCEDSTSVSSGKAVPACQTPGSKSEDDQSNAISSGTKKYIAEKTITLADLMANWHKPTKISVVVEVK